MVTEMPNVTTEPSEHVFFFFFSPGYAAKLTDVMNDSFSRGLIFVGYLSGPPSVP